MGAHGFGKPGVTGVLLLQPSSAGSAPAFALQVRICNLGQRFTLCPYSNIQVTKIVRGAVQEAACGFKFYSRKQL